MTARLTTPAEAHAFLRANGAVLLADGGPERPSLARAIAGGAVQGSWWSHPKARLIFRLATALEDGGEAVVLKLVDGKVTFLHRRLWPALWRVVSDRAFRTKGERGLTAAARALLARVRKHGTVRLEQKAGPAKKALEQRLLALVSQEHGETGAHFTVLRSWEAWATPAARAEGDALTAAAARAALAACGAEPSPTAATAARRPPARPRRSRNPA
jgi:hypothetical protein